MAKTEHDRSLKNNRIKSWQNENLKTDMQMTNKSLTEILIVETYWENNESTPLRFWGEIWFYEKSSSKQSKNGNYLKWFNFTIHKTGQLLISFTIKLF